MAAIDKKLDHLIRLHHETGARLARIERLLNLNVRETVTLEHEMATFKQQFIDEVHRTQDIEKAANAAMNKLTQSNTDLANKLADAINNSDLSKDPEVMEALQALQTSNNEQKAATPVVAEAIANTDPNSTPPQLPAS